MRLYEVTYRNDYSNDRQTAYVTASTAVKAAEFVGKRNGKFVGYGGRVTSVNETNSTVYVAK